jgi:HPt (histidine-containing phosphotransfer) domain-containing protein
MAQLIDKTKLDRFSDKPALVHRLIQIYLDMSPKMLDEIQSAAADGDIEQVGQKAHSLKGSSAELGAAALADISHRLQMAAKEGGTSTAITLLIEELENCHQATIAALKDIDPG